MGEAAKNSGSFYDVLRVDEGCGAPGAPFVSEVQWLAGSGKFWAGSGVPGLMTEVKGGNG